MAVSYINDYLTNMLKSNFIFYYFGNSYQHTNTPFTAKTSGQQSWLYVVMLKYLTKSPQN